MNSRPFHHQSRRVRRRALFLAGLAIATPLAAPIAAHAGSISFIRGGNVWVASTDGVSQVQVTTTGGYSYQSRADDGSFIALQGRRLHRLSPTGQLLADFDTPVSGEQTAPHTSFFRGPYKPEISPDGTKVAYEYWHQAYLSDPGCAPVGTPQCTDSRISVGIGYSYPDRQTSWDEPGLGRQSGWIDPSWIDNTTLLQSDKSVRPNVDTIIDHPGDGNQTIERWFEDTNAWYLRDGELSRRGDAGAWVSTKIRDWSDPKIGQEDDQVTIYKLGGAPPALPEQCFSFQDPEAIFSGPTISADGSRIAFASKPRGGGATTIVAADLPNQAAGCQLPSAGTAPLIADATAPDFSPAPVPVMPVAGGGAGNAAGGGPGPGGAGNGAGGTGSAPGGTGDSAPPAPLTVKSTKLRRVLGAGLSVAVTVPGSGRLQLTALRGKTVVGTASAKAKKAGTVQLKVKLTKAARRALATKKSATLQVRYRFTPKNGPASQGAVTVTLKR